MHPSLFVSSCSRRRLVWRRGGRRRVALSALMPFVTAASFVAVAIAAYAVGRGGL